MAKQQTFWTCDICGSQYEAEDRAIACETQRHKDVSEAKIERFGFSRPATGMMRSEQDYYPSSVTIRFSDESNDFAMYRLSQVGFKGI